jgi:DNA repair photolyase
MSTETIVSPLQESDLSKKSLCDYVINVGSGCRHKCLFCYVSSTPAIRTRTETLKSNGVENPQLDWGDYLFIREDVPRKLEEMLRRKRSWKSSASGQGIVLLCSGTDPYQNPRTAAITRESVQILLRYDKRVRILTRSPLWIRDLDVLVHPNVTVGMSLPHLDAELSRQVEVNAPRPSDRIAALQRGREAGCRLFIAMAPTVPMHGQDEFRQLFETVLSVQPEVIFWEPINARGSNSTRMRAGGLEWVDEVSDGKKWAQNFMTQWQAIEAAAEQAGCLPLVHPWFDKKLRHHIPEEEWWTRWFNRPTVETWA